MSTSELLLAVVEAGIWLAFIGFGLYAVRSRIGPWWSAGVLLALAYLGFVTCPMVRETGAWERVSGYGFKEWSFGVAEAALWYAFVGFALDTLRTGRKLWWASLVLLALFYAAFLVCPWVRDTDAWRQLWR